MYLRRMPLISPSILSADFGNLQRDIEMINSSNADWIHCDIMDGRFVPNISFGFPVIEAVKKVSKKPLDVHLMILEPEKYIEDFKKAGADILTIHLETSPHLQRTIAAIQQTGMKAGVAINPHSSIVLLENILHDADVILVMSVNPGFGGQKFLPQTYQKIRGLKQLIADNNSHTKIEVDGGVGPENAESLVKAGADILVAGNSIFSSADPIGTIASLKSVRQNTSVA
jgi:ribulose-phosphate 3-epimerase